MMEMQGLDSASQDLLLMSIGGRQQRVSSVRAPFLAYCDRDCRLCHRIPLSGMQTHQWASLDHEDEGREAAESLSPKDTGLLP